MKTEGKQKHDCLRAVLHQSLSCRLGLTNGSEAFVVPVIFTYTYDTDRKGYDIFLHFNCSEHSSNDTDVTSTLDYLYYHQKMNIDVCVEFDIVGPFIPNVDKIQDVKYHWTLAYSRMVGYGKVSRITCEEEKNSAFWRQILRYTGKDWKRGKNIPKEATYADVWKVSLDSDRTDAKYHHIEYPSKSLSY